MADEAARAVSLSANVFIRYKGTKPALVKILADNFLVRLHPKHDWLMDFIEIHLSRKREWPDAFEGRIFGGYDYVISGTTYLWSSDRGSIRDAFPAVMDALAQGLAWRLKSRTAICWEDGEDLRRYRYVAKKKGPVLIDEKTRKPPTGLFQ